MELKRLNEGGVYDMFVVSVLYNRQFQVGNDTRVSYFVTLKDDEGNVYKPEYVFSILGKQRPDLDEKANADFPIGQRVQFRCQLSVPKCDEILPVAAGTAGAKPPGQQRGVYKPEGQVQNTPHTLVAGHSYSQALTLATQIVCAECTSLGKEINTEALFGLAAELDDWLIQRKEMHGF